MTEDRAEGRERRPGRGADRGPDPGPGGSGPTVVDVRGARPEDPDLSGVVSHLTKGGLLAHPTETVYGLGSLARPPGLERLLRLKGRDAGKPVLLLVPDIDAVADLEWTEPARELARVFWPGAVTLVLADPGRRFPPGVRSAAGTVAVRRTGHPLTARLVEELGEPMTSTSANAPGAPPARDGTEARDAVLELGGGEEVQVLDAGALPPSPPSTIVDCTTRLPRVVREGATPTNRLRCLLPEIDDAPLR